MGNGDLFYAFGIALAVSAVALSFVGLRSEKFPGRALPLAILWFAILAGGATTLSVLHAQDEEKHREAELHQAGEKYTEEEAQ
jgi:hypothetical protein